MKCRDCKHYEGEPMGSGVCLRQRWDLPWGAVAYGAAFGTEGTDAPDDCDMAEPLAAPRVVREGE